MAEFDDEGKALVTVQGPVRKDLAQSPQAAEHVGRAAAVQLAVAPLHLYGDCLNVVRITNEPRAKQTNHRLPYAALLRQVWLSADPSKVLTHTKVKAHQEVHNLHGEERWKAECNKHVDLKAKEATRVCHPVFDDKLVDKVKEVFDDLAQLCELVMAILPLWPRATRTDRMPRQPKLHSIIVTHDWQPLHDDWLRCTCCWRSVRKHRVQLCRQSCSGTADNIATIHASHKAVLIQVGEPPCQHLGVACTVCGSFAISKVKKLAKPCCTHPTWSAKVTQMLLNGRLPGYSRAELVTVE